MGQPVVGLPTKRDRLGKHTIQIMGVEVEMFDLLLQLLQTRLLGRQEEAAQFGIVAFDCRRAGFRCVRHPVSVA